MKPTVSISIITKNAMPRLRETLESVKWADEIIVVDSGSEDDTVEVCREYTELVYQTDWPGFGKQKQRALEKCSSSWVISIDADEVITTALKEEIEAAIKSAPKEVNAFSFPRLSYLCGQPIYHCGWRPDYIPRVFRNSFVSFSTSEVHERPLITGKTIILKNDLIHYSFDKIEDLLDKANFYSTLGAGMLKEKQKPSSVKKAFLKGLWSFIRTYFIKLGFLDGKYGFIISVAHAEGTYYKYLKLAISHTNRYS